MIWEYIPIIKVDQGELDYEFGKYVEVAQVRMKRRVLMLSVLNFIFDRLILFLLEKVQFFCLLTFYIFSVFIS
jgi:hypothetical protein